jgi:hypothetical protein
MIALVINVRRVMASLYRREMLRLAEELFKSDDVFTKLPRPHILASEQR